MKGLVPFNDEHGQTVLVVSDHVMYVRPVKPHESFLGSHVCAIALASGLELRVEGDLASVQKKLLLGG